MLGTRRRNEMPLQFLKLTPICRATRAAYHFKMTKKLLTVLFVLASTTAWAKCTITSQRTSTVIQAQRSANWDGWRMKNYDAVCAKLAKANARLMLVGNAVVLSNRSIGWVMVGLKDLNSDVATFDFASTRTTVNDHASQNIASSLLVESMHKAVDDWPSLDEAIVELDKARASARKK